MNEIAPSGGTGAGQDLSWLMRTIESVVRRQRPLVVNHLRELRRKHPTMTPAQMLARIERQYLAAVSTGGAAVGATAVAPGLGTAAALGLTAAETVAFLEASAFYAQSITEIHGISVREPERSEALVMSLMLGQAGSQLVQRVAQQSMGKGAGGTAFWGRLITTAMPTGVVGQVLDTIRKAFMRRLAANTGRNMLGRIMPFGIGAVIGGIGNNILGRHVISTAHEAFGDVPEWFTTHLDPQPKEITATMDKDKGKKPRRRLGSGKALKGLEDAKRIERGGLTGRRPWGRSADAAGDEQADDASQADGASQADPDQPQR